MDQGMNMSAHVKVTENEGAIEGGSPFLSPSMDSNCHPLSQKALAFLPEKEEFRVGSQILNLVRHDKSTGVASGKEEPTTEF